MKRIDTPLKIKDIQDLKAGDEISLSGAIFIARDQAHKQLTELIRRRKKLPFDLNNQVIYYCGPNPAPGGKVIGACGPTTSSRMDEFTPGLLKHGLKGMIGKGERSKEVIRAIKKYRGIYFLGLSGCGALLARYITEARRLAFGDLGPEAVYKIEVKDFPVIVGIDTKGRNIYDQRRRQGI